MIKMYYNTPACFEYENYGLLQVPTRFLDLTESDDLNVKIKKHVLENRA